MIVQNSVDNIVTLTISCPEKTNALTKALLADLVDALDSIANSPVRAVILTGAGRVFSVDAELDEAREGPAALSLSERLSARMATMPCLTIAAINGPLAGVAFGVVLAADLRIAVPEARFVNPVMKLGLLPPQTDARRLSTLVGPSRAKMILMAGATIDAAEARDWGLIDRIVPHDGLLAQAAALASDACAAETDHLMAIKAMIG